MVNLKGKHHMRDTCDSRSSTELVDSLSLFILDLVITPRCQQRVLQQKAYEHVVNDFDENMNAQVNDGHEYGHDRSGTTRHCPSCPQRSNSTETEDLPVINCCLIGHPNRVALSWVLVLLSPQGIVGRVPSKNLLDLGGQSLVIRLARSVCKFQISNVYVDTESQEIIDNWLHWSVEPVLFEDQVV